ncbi:MAG: glycosyltransferase family 39 protein [Deltaproteobacteria bacterium]|nr:glycosyltransferase family 39 protein [Deltaproteobacteria bacterium]
MSAPIPARARPDPVPAVVMVLFLLAHLPGLTQPPLDDHAWRQTDTAAVARNFSEEDTDILHPRVDARGEHSGITGMEFPLFNWGIHAVNSVAGFAHWHGRVLSLLAGLWGLWNLYLLGRRRYDVTTGRAAMMALATSPLFFFNARQVQPDVLMVSAGIAALFHATQYAAGGRARHLLGTVGWLGLACLVKVTAVFVGIPVLAVLWRARRLGVREFAAAVLLVGLPVTAWYLHSLHLSRDFGLAGHFNLQENPRVLLTASYWLHVFALRIPSSVITLIGALLALLGARRAWHTRDELAGAWLGAILLFQLVFPEKTHAHVYYSLPLTAPLALLAARGLPDVLERAGRRAWVPGALVLAMALNTAVRVRNWYRVDAPELARLEAFLDGKVPPDARVVVNGGPAPVLVYFSHRKGFTARGAEMDPAWFADKRARGARFFIEHVRAEHGPPAVALPKACRVAEDADFRVFRLDEGCPGPDPR